MRNQHEMQTVNELSASQPSCFNCQSNSHPREHYQKHAHILNQNYPPTNAPYGNTYNPNWRNHPNLSWKRKPPAYIPTRTQQQLPPPASPVEQALGWKIYDLKGINPTIFTHHIYLEEESKAVRQPQRRLNPHLQEVVRIEVLKLLQAGIIYPISDSTWVSPTQVVPKKSGVTTVKNEKGEELSTRLTTGWMVCIDYRRLNEVTRKYHFLLPFINQLLERVSGHPFYCFLDGYSWYFQIEISPEDQEKTTFTCPFGTYAYKRMPFGLWNAPAAFQRCMLSMFSDMVERIMEVYMDDITVYGGDFEECLTNLEAILQRCIEKNLVLNWKKGHFMVNQGIVLGHIISHRGIEVDKAKIQLISKLPSPTNVKTVRQFLGHAGFYRIFIKDFSKIAKPLYKLLEKDVKFVWEKECKESFEELKSHLTTAPIVRAPNWQLPFEVMCDASDLAIGAVLGQREYGKPHVLYYASKNLNEAERNYITTKKELLAVVYALEKFRAYLVGSDIVIFTDHSALKYLLTKQNAKARLIRWVLLLQEFNLQIKDKKGVDNVVVDHLSRLTIAHDTHSRPIIDEFCHAPDTGPTRLANSNRFRGAKPYTGTPFFFFFF